MKCPCAWRRTPGGWLFPAEDAEATRGRRCIDKDAAAAGRGSQRALAGEAAAPYPSYGFEVWKLNTFLLSEPVPVIAAGGSSFSRILAFSCHE